VYSNVAGCEKIRFLSREGQFFGSSGTRDWGAGKGKKGKVTPFPSKKPRRGKKRHQNYLSERKGASKKSRQLVIESGKGGEENGGSMTRRPQKIERKDVWPEKRRRWYRDPTAQLGAKKTERLLRQGKNKTKSRQLLCKNTLKKKKAKWSEKKGS